MFGMPSERWKSWRKNLPINMICNGCLKNSHLYLKPEAFWVKMLENDPEELVLANNLYLPELFLANYFFSLMGNTRFCPITLWLILYWKNRMAIISTNTRSGPVESDCIFTVLHLNPICTCILGFIKPISNLFLFNRKLRLWPTEQPMIWDYIWMAIHVAIAPCTLLGLRT